MRASVLLVVGASVAVVGTVAVLGATGTKQIAASQSPSSARLTLPVPPQCPSTVQPPHHLTLSTERGSKMALTDSCAYAPAGEDFTITFENEVVALSDGKGTYQNLSIYADQDSAITLISPDEFAVDQKKALFVGEDVLGPGEIVYRVPALPAGTYYVQSDSAADQLVATLVVE